MQITRRSIATAKGPGDWFTGDVHIDAVTAAAPPPWVTASLVHFMPGARVLFEADEEHWHGAAPDRLMVHLANNEADDQHDVAGSCA
ncbi:hypothetical protein [Micromonospora sp. KC723]|uniref:hypothetical protein n=1 Tax=Micromonospora sp. KC723 TaxID=2530381 RepID=UPI00104E5980|nr:hypothetical protein [Micromonospora sp. KC723]TDB78288.1 hypothetical protein E1165_01025 [Micromonospora sp. KC723]